MRCLSIISFVLSLFIVFAQDNEENLGQQQIQRETIEAILSMVSPECRSEMESAIESQTDVTEVCKLEIQKAVQTISGYNPRYQEDQPDQDGTQSQPDQKTPPPRSGIHPGFWIAAFVIALFGSAAAYIVQVSKILEDAFPQKAPKKLSKKKVNNTHHRYPITNSFSKRK
jgi:hypothetical protein